MEARFNLIKHNLSVALKVFKIQATSFFLIQKTKLHLFLKPLIWQIKDPKND